MSRAKLIAALHVAAKEAGLDEETRRDRMPSSPMASGRQRSVLMPSWHRWWPPCAAPAGPPPPG